VLTPTWRRAMIVVRNTFHIQAGQMKRAVEVAKQGRAVFQKIGLPVPRFYVDVASEFYTLVLESDYPNLGAVEQQMSQIFENADWQKWYEGFTPLVRNGRREIFRTVE
ncbi:MAG TPA: hypothetical protein VGT98_10675, partial [Candidatus Elarobacter sp.]|nr:hypothetical protein [Candidatus Elarobacter sp.]